jgi:NNP family nitrate/nitrite transporter-like MFS transporter
VHKPTAVRATIALAASTLAFTTCFAVWMMYGVLITFLVDTRVYTWNRAELGWLIGTPVLTGAILSIPAGVLTDRYGGRAVMTSLLLATSFPVFLVGQADTYWELLAAGLGVGMSGASFAVGVGYVSLWFRPERQGLVLGLFGLGIVGAAFTNLLQPRLLDTLTRDGTSPHLWRLMPQYYAAFLIVTAAVFWLSTSDRRIGSTGGRSLRESLAPLAHARVWRFGLYYSFMFGGFVALSQWLIPYYVNVYSTSVATAGVWAAAFVLTAAAVRAFGGWISDRLGARTVLTWALASSVVLLVLLLPPRVDVEAPGQGIVAIREGTVGFVSSSEVVVGDDTYPLQQTNTTTEPSSFGIHHTEESFLLLPTASLRQIPVVRRGDRVAKGQLLAKGVTHVYFQANRWIFTALVLLLGLAMGLGSGAVFKLIPSYFPEGVGMVGGAVAMLGTLGGFMYPIVFGYLLDVSGIWTTSWLLLAGVALVCLFWLRATVRRIVTGEAPVVVYEFGVR